MKFQLLFIALISLTITGCQTSGRGAGLFAGLSGAKKKQHTFDQSPYAKLDSEKSRAGQQIASDEFLKGEEELKKGNLKQARNHFKEVVKADPQNAAAHHRLGYIGDKQNEFTLAEIHYLAAMRLEPHNSDIASDLGYSYLLQGRNDDCRRQLEKALQARPDHKSALLNMASLHGQEGDYYGALSYFRRAGSEEEAQQNIARLFPDGPGNAKPKTQLAQQMPQNQIEQVSAELPNTAQRPFPGQQKRRQTPRKKDWRDVDPREIPTDQINDIFAEIDKDRPGQQQDDQLELSSPQKQSAPFPGMENAPAVAQQTTSPEQNNTRPGIPAPSGNALNLEDYAVVGAEETNSSEPHATGQPGQNTPPSSNLPPELASNPHSQSSLPPMNLESAPQPPASSVPADRYQEAMQLAMLMGMSAGPGQMFPVTSGSTPGSASGLPPVSSTMPGPPALNMNAPAGMPSVPPGYQPRQRLNIPEPEAIPTGIPGESSATSDPMSSPIAQPSLPPVERGSVPTEQAVADWPHREEASPDSIIQQASNSTPAESPWFESNDTASATNQNANQLPQTNPQYTSGIKQWPYSPQTAQQDHGTNIKIHRGTSQEFPNQPENSAAELPQIVPVGRR